MSRKSKILLASSAVVLLVAVLCAWGVRGALHGVPAFYHEAVEREIALAAKSSDEFLQQAAGVASDLRKPGRWEAVFTADQVNGWLAVDMPRNHPDLLPKTLSAPRVAIRAGDATLACKYEGPDLQSVLTISCDVYLSAPNVVAVRIKGARAGMMPLPLGKVLEAITHTAQQLEIPLEWRRTGGDPVALLSIALLQGHFASHRHIELDTIEFRDAEVYFTGRTERGPVAAAPQAVPVAAGAASAPPTGTAAVSAGVAAVTIADARSDSSKAPQSEPPASRDAKPAAAEAAPGDAGAAQPLVASPPEKEIIQR